MKDDIRARMERDMPMIGISQLAVDYVWALAWEHGHAYGESEVAAYYDEYSRIAKMAVGQKPA